MKPFLLTISIIIHLVGIGQTQKDLLGKWTLVKLETYSKSDTLKEDISGRFEILIFKKGESYSQETKYGRDKYSQTGNWNLSNNSKKIEFKNNLLTSGQPGQIMDHKFWLYELNDSALVLSYHIVGCENGNCDGPPGIKYYKKLSNQQ